MAKVHEIRNDYIKISVAEHGAELQSLTDTATGQEYIWSGDPAVWGKHSPVLFPIVGSLKENTYYYEGKPYQLGRHGFARDMDFSLSEQRPEALVFTLKSAEATLKNYPFPFELDIRYQLQEKTVLVTYNVKNTGRGDMWFSIGAHPAFKLPLFEGDAYVEYHLEFEKTENAGKWPILEGGLIAEAPVPFLENTNKLPLNKNLFVKDALVFKDLQSEKIALVSDKTGKGFVFSWKQFPFFGIWAAPGADFICLEPWCGIADSTGSSQELTQKEGINRLEAGGHFKRTWSVTINS
ncbi:aldose epimerase [Niabella ginsenosidivorans]|uniref:Aldose epimerase n=1 Tax=Niabella ginsenosidivorans TaxID=1176587 RepID=A0A1A9I138_9BACT|nr:aldose 1-epimerase family protein [Niabella ginsenosidivorans]ANH80274.1 aldose epimerase [Niabella ginsenosidivorans]